MRRGLWMHGDACRRIDGRRYSAVFNGSPRFVWVLALAGCFVDSGGTSTTDAEASDSATSTTAATTGDETAAGGTGGSGATTMAASTAMSTSGDATTTDATATDASGGTDVMGSSGGECQPLAQLAMTDGCVKGVDIASEAWGTKRCEEEFGAGWTWIEHHYQGGWDVEGVWIEEASVGLRGWVQVTDQNSECFSNGGIKGVTWARTACSASCHPGCDAYVGDTPCDQCLRLICVAAGP